MRSAMFTSDDLIDLILSQLAALPAAPAAPPGAAPPKKETCKLDPAGPRGRIFLTEYEIKKRLTPPAERLTIPKEAIISPLAEEWLALRGVKIVRE